MSAHRYMEQPRLCRHCGKPTREHTYACRDPRDVQQSWKPRRPTDIYACEPCNRGFASSEAVDAHKKTREHRDAVQDARALRRSASPALRGPEKIRVDFIPSSSLSISRERYKSKFVAKSKINKRHVRAARSRLLSSGLTNRQVALALHAAAEESPALAYAREQAEMLSGYDTGGECQECGFEFHAWEDCPRNPEND